MRDALKDEDLRNRVNDACAIYNQGQIAEAGAKARSIISDVIDDPDLDSTDIDVLNTLKMINENALDFECALIVIRRIAALQNRCPADIGYAYFRALENSGLRAIRSDFERGPGAEGGCHIVIACIPKTGSTFLMNALRQATGFSAQKLCLNYSNEENLLYPPFVVRRATSNLIAQEHLRASPQNLAVLQAYARFTVVLVRNIFDSLVSMRDMLLGPGFGSTTAFFTEQLKEMDDETQMDAIIAKWAHWQIEFLASWTRALQAGRIEGFLLTYEQMTENKPGAIVEICARAGLTVSPEDAAATVEAVEGSRSLSRMNKGVSGRGAAMLNDRQKDSVRSLTRFYPDIDFSPLGLPA